MTIRQLSSRVVYSNKWMTVREDAIERDNGTPGIYGVVEKCDSAIVLAIDNDQIYMVEQYRYPTGERSLEFPQGSLEKDGVDPLEIAREELQGETGLWAKKWECLGEIYIACAYTDQKAYAFVATELTHAPLKPDLEEHDLVARKVSLVQLHEFIRDNHIKDAQTLAAWGLYQARLASVREMA